MRPIEFQGQNKTYAADQDCYGNLPAHAGDDEWGIVTACWSMSWWERLRVLWNGCVWVQIMTFNQELQPSKVCASKPDLLTYATQEEGRDDE